MYTVHSQISIKATLVYKPIHYSRSMTLLTARFTSSLIPKELNTNEWYLSRNR